MFTSILTVPAPIPTPTEPNLNLSLQTATCKKPMVVEGGGVKINVNRKYVSYPIKLKQ
jgi:hypothetical protein